MMETDPVRMDGKSGTKTKVGGWEEYVPVVHGTSLSQCVPELKVAVDQHAGTRMSYTLSDHKRPELSVESIREVRCVVTSRVSAELDKVYPEYHWQDIDVSI